MKNQACADLEGEIPEGLPASRTSTLSTNVVVMYAAITSAHTALCHMCAAGSVHARYQT